MNEFMRSLALFLPALMPSWRFFEVIRPSPRIEFALLGDAEGQGSDWRAFRPKPKRLAALVLLDRLFWNPLRNEDLYLLTCAEKLEEGEDAHCRDAILRSIRSELRSREPEEQATLQFRIATLRRDGEALRREIVYLSPPEPPPSPDDLHHLRKLGFLRRQSLFFGGIDGI